MNFFKQDFKILNIMQMHSKGFGLFHPYSFVLLVYDHRYIKPRLIANDENKQDIFCQRKHSLDKFDVYSSGNRL